MRSRAWVWTFVAVAVGGTLASTVLLLALAYRVFVIPSGSMRPTLDVGSYVLIDKTARSPRDGDIVVFRTFDDEPAALARCCFVKRVLARNGETIACCTGGAVTRNGTALHEPYVLEDDSDLYRTFGPVRVPSGRLWVMGDDRPRSADSRFHIGNENHGTVAESDVIGTVVQHGSRASVYGSLVGRAALLDLPVALGATLLVWWVGRRGSKADPAAARED